MRSERRRLARERQAVEMNNLEDHSAANLASIAPILDDAINQLGAEDRAAILLRFFEQHDFQAVGNSLGINEDAARKRVDRALDKLESMLKRRGVGFSAAALAATLATQAVSAAPAGLAVSVSSVVLSGTAVGSGTALTILKIMSMTKLQIGIAAVVVAVGVSLPLVMQQRTQTRLTAAQEQLQKRDAELKQLASENERLSNLVARSSTQVAASPAGNKSNEVLKLRGEVGRLRNESIANASARTNGPSALSGLTANPEMYKLIRDQQKMAMGMIYKDFTKQLNLSTNDSEKLSDVVADHVMDNVQLITELLHDHKSPEDMEAALAAQEGVGDQKIQELLGVEGYTKYKEYTKNLASYLTSEQFKPQLSGDKAAKDSKAKQLYDIMLEETQNVLAKAGLPSDYQTVPTMKFINIASEPIGERNLKLLDDIYASVLARTPSFLSEAEIKKFGEFRKAAVNNNRAGLLINRKMMAPGGS
jgi:hypothetical protein